MEGRATRPHSAAPAPRAPWLPPWCRDDVLVGALLEDAPVLLVLVGADGRVERVSGCFQRRTGLPADAVVGRTWFGELGPELEPVEAPPTPRPTPLTTLDGDTLLVEWTHWAVTPPGGVPLGWIALGRDVTDRERAQRLLAECEGNLRRLQDTEERLRRSEQRLTQAHRVAGLGAWERDLATGEIWWSEEQHRQFGVPEGTPLSQAFFEGLVHPEDRASIRLTLEELLANGRAHVGYRVQLPDGRVKHLEGVASVAQDELGRPARIVGTNLDVTDRVEREAALRASEARYALVERAVEIGIWDFDLVTGRYYLSPQWEALLGYSEAERTGLGRDWPRAVHPDDRATAQAALARHLHARERYCVELRLRHRDGTYRWMRSRGEALRDAEGRAVRMVGSVTDVTEPRRVEHRLRERERYLAEQARLLESIFEHSIDQVAILDANYTFLRVSASYARSSGFTADQLLGRNHFEVFPSDFQAEHEPYRKARTLYSRRGRPFTYPDHPEWGTTYWDLSLVPIPRADGETEYFIFTLKEVTAQRRAEDALAERSERLRLALEASGQGTWELDVSTGAVTYGVEHARLLADTGDECAPRVAAAFTEGVHPDDRAEVEEALAEYVGGQRARFQAKHRVRTRHGLWKWVLATGTVTARDARGGPLRVSGTHLDVDATRRAAAELAERLREKDTLLREIHHRVKNNLQVISSLLHFQERRAAQREDTLVFSELRNRLMAMTLVHEKLYQSADLASVDMGEYVRALVGALGDSLQGQGRVRFVVLSELVRLPLEQALPAGMLVCELVTNIYKYAFPEGRTGSARLSVTQDRGMVSVEATDDGVGFPEGFDPELSGQFGWSLIRSLARQLDGEVVVTRGPGAQVVLRFPLGTPRRSSRPPASAEEGAP